MVFTGVFNFQWESHASRHVFFHLNLPLPDYFIHVIVICKANCVAFKFTSQKLEQIVASLVAYWHVLLKAWPKQDPCQGVAGARRTPLTTKFRACARVDKLPPSFFT
jgi:hypothetical protein